MLTQRGAAGTVGNILRTVRSGLESADIQLLASVMAPDVRLLVVRSSAEEQIAEVGRRIGLPPASSPNRPTQ